MSTDIKLWCFDYVLYDVHSNTFVLADSQESAIKAYDNLMIKLGQDWALYEKNIQQLTIYVVEPDAEYIPRWEGKYDRYA